MNKYCVKKVLKLQKDSEAFADLTIEQLLYACVAACGVQETKYVLKSTKWKKWCPNVRKGGIHETQIGNQAGNTA